MSVNLIPAVPETISTAGPSSSMQQLQQLRNSLFGGRDSKPESEESATEQVVDILEDLAPTPIYITQRTRLILLAAMLLAVIWLFSLAPSVLRLLLIGATFALVLSFPVRLLERWLPRGLAIFIVISSVVAMAIIGLILIVPFAINEITQFAEQVPAIAESVENTARDVLMQFYRRGWIDRHPDLVIEDAQGNLLERSQTIAEQLLNSALEVLTRSFSLAITSFGVIFVATYLLIDIPRFREQFVSSFSPAYRPDAAKLWSTIGESLSRYLAGLMISVLIQGMLATVGLLLLDIPYAIVLGVWMSVTAILPYVGAFLAGIPAVMVALTISWEMAIVVTVLYVAINQVEGNFITPRIQGSAVRVHPLVIFVAVIGGTQVAGPLGAILAVPTLAVFRVLLEFMWVRLQVPETEMSDTVLVALGGDDDAESDVEVTTEGGNAETGTDVTVEARADGDMSIEIDRPAPEAAEQAAAYAAYRPRPTVKRRQVQRKHRIASPRERQLLS
jgi:predicted PurR-regulated permease PerM